MFAAAMIAMFAALLGVAVAAGFVTIQDAAAIDRRPESAAAPVVTTRVLLEETERLVDDEWTVYRFHLTRESDVELEMAIIRGEGFTAYVMATGDYANFPNGSWRQYELFRANGKTQHRALSELPPGDYVLLMKESSNPNIIGGSDSAFVRVRMTATTRSSRDPRNG